MKKIGKFFIVVVTFAFLFFLYYEIKSNVQEGGKFNISEILNLFITNNKIVAFTILYFLILVALIKPKKGAGILLITIISSAYFLWDASYHNIKLNYDSLLYGWLMNKKTNIDIISLFVIYVILFGYFIFNKKKRIRNLNKDMIIFGKKST